MAWTTPKSWVAAEVPTAAMFNTHIRDNELILKAPFDDNAKVVALDAAHLADLSGANLVGVAKLAADNTFAGGRQDFSAGITCRFRFPVGADKYAGSPGNKTAGSVWVEGTYLHHVDDDKEEWRWLGTLVGTPGGGALSGSGWVEDDNTLHFIDASADERKVIGITGGGHSDMAARAGAVWIDTDDYLHYINLGPQEYIGHDDVPAHGDGGHVDVHSNTHTNSHSNAGHSDSHTNTAHQDGHANAAHVDSHSNTAHEDGHSNTHDDHADGGDPHEDSHDDTHSNVAHDDAHSNAGHADSHTNTAHANSHTNAAHANSHSDVAHVDTHSNAAHGDHADAHANKPESMGT